MADKNKYRKLSVLRTFSSGSIWQKLTCVLQAIVFKVPKLFSDGFYIFEDQSGIDDRPVLESNVGSPDGIDDVFNFGIGLASKAFTYENGTGVTQNGVTDASGDWFPSAGNVGDIRFMTALVFDDWFKVDEADGTILYNSVQGRTNASLSGIDVNTFWVKDNDFTSFQNEVGYNSGTGDELIPAQVDSAGELTGLDANGNILKSKLTGGYYELIFEGDSLTVGTGSTIGNDYPSQLKDNLLSIDSYSITNNSKATAGNTVSQMITQGFTEIDPLINYSREIIIFWGGVNDLDQDHGLSGEDAASRVQAWVTDRLSAHSNAIILICNMIDNDRGIPDYDNKRSAFNNNLKNINNVTIIDLDSDVRFDPSDPSVYSDNIHLTDVGYSYVMDHVYNILEPTLTAKILSSNQYIGYYGGKGKVRYNAKIVDSSVYKLDGIAYCDYGIKSEFSFGIDAVTMYGEIYIDSSRTLQNLISTKSVGDSATGFALAYSSSVGFGMFLEDTGTVNTVYAGTTNTPLNEMFKFVYIRSDRQYLYINKKLVAVNEYVLGNGDQDRALTFGYDSNNGRVGLGKIGTFSMYKGLNPTQEQITKLFEKGSIGNETFFPKCAETGGDISYDSSINTNHGIKTNANLALFHSTDLKATPYNLLDGFDLWQNDITPTNYVRVPFDVNKNSILTDGDVLTGYTWVSRNPSGAWHNNAESKLLQYPSNNLVQIEAAIFAATGSYFWTSDGYTPISKNYTDFEAEGGNVYNGYQIIYNLDFLRDIVALKPDAAINTPECVSKAMKAIRFGTDGLEGELEYVL